MQEEGVYLIRRVDKLPERGSTNYLYILKDSDFSMFHRWNEKGSYETIDIHAVSANVTPEFIRDRLQSLSGDDRLDASAIKGISSGADDIYVDGGVVNVGTARLLLSRTAGEANVEIIITDLLDLKNFTATDNVNINNHEILGVSTPTTGTSAANRDYVDTISTMNRIHLDPVIDKDLITPPGSSTTGDRYIVAGGGGTATGLWFGEENNIATSVSNGTSWTFETPVNGATLSVEDEQSLYVYETTTNSWIDQGGVSNHNSLSGIQGGTSGEYNHLTNAQITTVNSVLTTDVIGASQPNPDTLRYTRRNGTTFDLILGVTTPSVHNFNINIASRVDLNTNLNTSHTVTYSVTNRGSIQSIELIVLGGDNKTLTIPSIDGVNTESVILSGIDTSSNTTLTFSVRITDTQSNTHNSNIQTVEVRNIIPAETARWGTSITDTPTNTELDAGTIAEVVSGSHFDVNITPGSGQYLFIEVPQDRDISTIVERTLGIEVKSSFTKTTNAGRNSFVYTRGPQSGVPVTYRITVL